MTTSPQTIAEIGARVRGRLSALLASGQPTGGAALLLANIEDEQERHRRAVADLARRADEQEAGPPSRRGRLMDRPHPAGLDPRASRPSRTIEEITEAQAKRGVVFVCRTGNPTFYRSVIDRLEPGERVRNVSGNHGIFEFSREEFLRECPDAARTDSYRIGSPSAPGSCRYTTGSPTAGMIRLHRKD